ncbi:MAG: hypothetical protein DDT40_01397 [candidate division WS2 bacterium]|nr:hypothetical protein [Candidatus Psychracetigena formicireducens]
MHVKQIFFGDIMAVQVSDRWQVTIPKEVREDIKLKKGQKICFIKIADHRHAIIAIPQDPIKALKSSIDPKKNFKDIIREGRTEWRE